MRRGGQFIEGILVEYLSERMVSTGYNFFETFGTLCFFSLLPGPGLIDVTVGASMRPSTITRRCILDFPPVLCGGLALSYWRVHTPAWQRRGQRENMMSPVVQFILGLWTLSQVSPTIKFLARLQTATRAFGMPFDAHDKVDGLRIALLR